MTEAGSEDRSEFEVNVADFTPAPQGWWVLLRAKGGNDASGIRPLAGWITTIEYGRHKFFTPAIQADDESNLVPCDHAFGEGVQWLVVRTEELTARHLDMMGTSGRTWQS